jgi:hypothetical protein
VPPYPGLPPGPAPGAPPASPPSATGEAAEADEADAADIGAAIEELAQLDRKAADAVAAIEAAGEAGRRAMADIAAAVDAKITELGPRLNTPQGQQELRDFLTDRLTAARQILDEQNQIALDMAREIHEIAERYSEIGRRTDSDRESAPPHAADDGGAPASGSSSVPPPAPTPAESAPTTPASSPLAMPGMMPGALSPGGMMPSMPGFGGGGMPAGGVTDPLSALGGLGQPPVDNGLKLTDEPPTDGADTSKDEPSLRDDPAPSQAGDHRDTSENASDTSDPATQAAAAPDPGDPEPAPAGTDVRLPDGTTVHAPSAHAADAVRAALNGASVSEAYQQAGITVPPAGTPVLDPVAPGELRAGDVGVWKDHLVMALGDGKVLVSGQVQPQSSVGSGPDFLGWMRPVRDHGDGPAPAPPQTPPGPA